MALASFRKMKKMYYYAVNSVISLKKSIAKSEDIKNHGLLLDMTQPTFHRCLKKLLHIGFLAHAPNTIAGSYVSATEDQFSEALSP